MILMALKNLRARKVRSILCILAVIVCVYLNGSTATMNKWMYESMTGELAKYMGKVYVQQSGSGYPAFDSAISEETAGSILGQTGGINAAESAPVIFIRTERGMMPFMPAQSMVIGLPPGKEGVFLGSVEASSGQSRFSGEEGYEAILGKTAAETYKAEVGDEIAVNNQSVRVAGILERSVMDSVNISAIMPLADVQKLFSKEGTVSCLLLTANDVNKVSEIAGSLKQEYASLEVTTQDDMLNDAQDVLEMPMMYMSMMSVTAFIVAVAVLMSTMMMAVMERTKEIGILRAVGAQKKRILGAILVEVMVMCFIGGIPGALLSIPMAGLMGTTLPQLPQLAEILAFAVIAGVVSAMLPAYRALRIEPIEALRYE